MEAKYFENVLVGHQQAFSGGMVFFGNKNGTLPVLKKTFPKLQFNVLNQVHGNALMPVTTATYKATKADGHFTTTKNLALVVVTADCVPVFYTHQQQVVGLHCGWRGVELQLLRNSLKQLKVNDLQRLYIGPHILGSHFEVSSDIAKSICEHYQGEGVAMTDHPEEGKKYVDLSEVLRDQAGLAPEAVTILPHNTLIDENYHSYRENKTTQRNYSFIVKTADALL